MVIKAIFIDIDGTLRDSNENLREETIEAVKKVTEKGILVILCSGRPKKYTEKISRECFASKYVITSSGAIVYDYEEDEVLYINEMDKKAVVKLYEIADSNDVRFIMHAGDERVTNKIKHPGEEKKLEEDIRDFVKENSVTQCTIIDDNYDKVKDMIQEIRGIENIEISNMSKSLVDRKFADGKGAYCDFVAVNTNKGNGVKKLLEILNIKKEEAIAIGDDSNDIEMFKQVGYKVAVANALDSVKEEADEVILSNDENGVAWFLREILEDRF